MVAPDREAAYRLRGSHGIRSYENGVQSTTPREDQRRRRGQAQANNTALSWNGNNLGATNDDKKEYQPSVTVVNGYPVDYSCLDDPRQADHDIAGRSVNSISVLFDYEMVINRNADFDRNLESLEWSILWSVAETIGMHVCDFDRLSGKNGSRRRKLEDRESFILKLSSLARDEVDHDIDQCTFLVDSRTQNAVCTPIRGRMTADFVGDADFVRQLLLKKIEQEMDSGRTRIEDVTTVLFVGDRDAVKFVPDRNMDQLVPNGTTTTGLALIVGVIVAVVAILSIPLFLLRGRRKRQTAAHSPARPRRTLRLDAEKECRVVTPAKSGDTEETFPEKGGDMDNQTTCAVASGGATASSVLDVASAGATTRSDLAVASAGTVASIYAVASAWNTSGRYDDDTDSTSTSVSDENSTHQSVEPTSCRVVTRGLTNQESETTTQNEVTTIPGSEIDHSSSAAANIPPPLPLVPVDETSGQQKEVAKSKTLQTRRKRRKKKKKKKPVLERISSRSSIDEMETIREEGDDVTEEECDDEDGSEYSTDDDDEPFAALTEASGPAVAAMVPPSPIKEEPHIRRLPPPWI